MKIGFCSDLAEHVPATVSTHVPRAVRCNCPRRSVVRVRFGDNTSLTYFNDSFDLRVGDGVYVEGSRAGELGHVTDINYTFKIKRGEYKRVLSVIDTEVHGEFFPAGSHYITFDRAALPPEQVRTWFLSPSGDEEDFISGTDGSAFPLDDLRQMDILPKIAARGNEYYQENRVRYLALDGNRGYAIVEGTHPYEVEFTYDGGMVSGLTCSCFCSFNCKHEFAAMLQLDEVLSLIRDRFPSALEATGFFAVIFRAVLLSVAVSNMEEGSLTL